ncbi:biotin carboxyl carrier protein of acetyl-CoA carboxylase isoform X2 [Ananas comosus]|uniref:Biotin carboxyl carrier protein of acetyl-CoA carboxylase isoform X2 n=1 Tax=Ananas comosus TaxID=4615 RepID=A0A6P5GJR6_ANACO|nr:biotin carboxyl carrier protein of acetyl-CoA carboxylase isoform X2 [Ananas comosus]
MDACRFGGVSNVKLFNLHSEFGKFRCSWLFTPCMTKYSGVERLSSCRKTPAWYETMRSVRYDRQLQGSSLSMSCASSSENISEAIELEKSKAIRSQIIPQEVESFISTLCDTSSIVEVKLKRTGFQLYVKRSVEQKDLPAPLPYLPAVQPDNVNQVSHSNGSAAATPLAISPAKSSAGGIQRILDTASDEGLVILQSPKVGYFRRSRTIKGKRAPPSCKEKQEVKEGQVLCYIEQLGGEIPIESDVSGEVIKILREDGEPVGYGDALIAILPSFPGIKLQ